MRPWAEEGCGESTAQMAQELFPCLPSDPRMKNEFSSQATIHLGWLRSAFTARLQAQTPLSPANFLCWCFTRDPDRRESLITEAGIVSLQDKGEAKCRSAAVCAQQSKKLCQQVLLQTALAGDDTSVVCSAQLNPACPSPGPGGGWDNDAMGRIDAARIRTLSPAVRASSTPQGSAPAYSHLLVCRGFGKEVRSSAEALSTGPASSMGTGATPAVTHPQSRAGQWDLTSCTPGPARTVQLQYTQLGHLCGHTGRVKVLPRSHTNPCPSLASDQSL